jgi:hypothetical protein
MIRIVVTVVAFLSLMPAASATLATRREPTIARKDSVAAYQKALPRSEHWVSGRKQEGEFVITDETAVFLDGRACRYKDVPDKAHIASLEVAPDRKTVLKVHFRTAK